MHVRPRGDDDDFTGWEVHHILTAANHASSQVEELLTEAERRAERQRRREALARKRPPGFAPWPEDRR